MCDYYLKRQAKCLNCKLIYYTYLVQRGDNYCSIDCNTNHNYLKNIVKIIKNKINELNDTEINDTEINEINDTEINELNDTEINELNDTEINESNDTEINELNDTEINEFFQFIKEDITEPSPILIDYIFNELKFNNDY